MPDQLVDILLIGWLCSNRVTFWESQLLVFWFQLIWSLCAGGQHTANFFHLVGGLVSANQLKDMVQDIIYSP